MVIFCGLNKEIATLKRFSSKPSNFLTLWLAHKNAVKKIQIGLRVMQLFGRKMQFSCRKKTNLQLDFI